MSEESGVWEIRLGVYATRQQAEDVKERIIELLCPDPHHAPSCPVPWSVSMFHRLDPGEQDAYAALAEQARIESRTRP